MSGGPNYVITLLILVMLAYVIIIYNGLISLRNSVRRAWSNIDVLLMQRYDEIPKLVAVCEGYMSHERITLEEVVHARSLRDKADNPEQQTRASNSLSSALQDLFAVSEKYPELKSDVNFRQLQGRISELEDQIADRREFYNESVTVYNNHVQKFPDSIIASLFGHIPAHLWKIKKVHREIEKVSIRGSAD